MKALFLIATIISLLTIPHYSNTIPSEKKMSFQHKLDTQVVPKPLDTTIVTFDYKVKKYSLIRVIFNNDDISTILYLHCDKSLWDYYSPNEFVIIDTLLYCK